MADDENQPGWAAPGQSPREPAAPVSPAPGEQTQPVPPPSAPSAAWQAVPSVPGPVQGAPPPGVPRRGGRTWLFLLIALLSVTVIMVIVGSVLFAGRTLPPYNGAHDFLSDLTHLRDNAAEARLCTADRDNGERAVSAIRATFGRGGKILVNPFDVDRTGNHALVSYSVDVAGTDRTPSYDLPMREEGGRWLACPLSGEG
jgi:hypothetical protein